MTIGELIDRLEAKKDSYGADCPVVILEDSENHVLLHGDISLDHLCFDGDVNEVLCLYPSSVKLEELND